MIHTSGIFSRACADQRFLFTLPPLLWELLFTLQIFVIFFYVRVGKRMHIRERKNGSLCSEDGEEILNMHIFSIFSGVIVKT